MKYANMTMEEIWTICQTKTNKEKMTILDKLEEECFQLSEKMRETVKKMQEPDITAARAELLEFIKEAQEWKYTHARQRAELLEAWIEY